MLTYAHSDAGTAALDDSLIAVLTATMTDKKFVAQFDEYYKVQRSYRAEQPQEKMAPDFVAYDTLGRRYTSKSFRGKIVLIDVWASWCAPCVEEIPHLKALAGRLDTSRFQLVSISMDKDRVDWISKGLLRFRPAGLALWFPGTDARDKFQTDYNCLIIPVVVVLDKSGGVVTFNPPRASDGSKLYDLLMSSEH